MRRARLDGERIPVSPLRSGDGPDPEVEADASRQGESEILSKLRMAGVDERVSEDVCGVGVARVRCRQEFACALLCFTLRDRIATRPSRPAHPQAHYRLVRARRWVAWRACP